MDIPHPSKLVSNFIIEWVSTILFWSRSLRYVYASRSLRYEFVLVPVFEVCDFVLSTN